MKPFWWALLTALVWGCVPVLEKLGLAKIPALAGIFYRSLGVVLGVVLLFFFQFPEIKKTFAHVPQGFWYLIAGGFLASFVGQFFFYNALKNGEASKVVPLAATYPLVAFIIGILVLGEKLTLLKAGGIAFVILGVILLH